MQACNEVNDIFWVQVKQEALDVLKAATKRHEATIQEVKIARIHPGFIKVSRA